MSLINHPRAFVALFAASLALNESMFGYLALRIARKGGIRYVLERLDLRDARPVLADFQEDLRAYYRKLPDAEGETVFVGDSLIGGGPWAELFSPIKNRGIGGETTARLLDRLGEVTESRPRKIFIEVGTNCLASDIPVAQVVRNYRKILQKIASESPASAVYVLSILPVNQTFPGGPVHDNASIRETNARLKTLVQEYPQARFLDVFDALTDSEGNLRRDLTVDGLHLNLDGYLTLGAHLKENVLGPGPIENRAVVDWTPKGDHLHTVHEATAGVAERAR